MIELTKFEMCIILGLVLTYLILIFRLWDFSRTIKPNYLQLLPKFILRISIFICLFSASYFSIADFNEKQSNDLSFDKSDEIYLLIDLSNSMNTKDVQPTRLEKVKFEIETFIKNRKEGKIGIIVFAENARLFVPLTSDFESLTIFVESLNTDFFLEGSSDLNLGLTEFIQKVDSNFNQIGLIIFTDGGETETNVSNDIIQKIKNLKVKVAVVGVGTANGGVIFDAKGEKILSEDKQEIISKLNENNLKKIASELSGSYYFINNFKNQMKEVEDTFASSKPISKMIYTKDFISFNYFVYLLLLTLLLVLIEIMLRFEIIKL